MRTQVPVFRYTRQVRRNIVRREARRQGVPMRYLWRLMHAPRTKEAPARKGFQVPTWVMWAMLPVLLIVIGWMVWRVAA
jgi:hypothetical protein